MTNQQALDLIKWIPKDKIKKVDAFKFGTIEARCNRGAKPDEQESKFLNDVYCYTSNGDNKEAQPFKAYRRKRLPV